MIDPQILAKVWREPELILAAGEQELEALLVLTDSARLTAALGDRIEQAGLWPHLPQKVRDCFEASYRFAEFRNRQILWEMECLERTLREADFEVIVLKGAAYLLLGLPWARRRLPADLDVLVAREHLALLEELLIAEGFEPAELTPYDQRYYREWMHELPPLRHPERQIEVDVHHALLPCTARIQADPKLLWSTARAVSDSRFKVLGAEDMILHAAVHLFYDSDLNNRLRDLVDIDQLLRYFSDGEEDFWQPLLERAQAHGLERPLIHALYYSHKFLATPIPEDLPMQAVSRAVRQGMDFLVERSLFPKLPGHFDGIDGIARWLLYARSHYLRMPLRLLLPHLLYKASKRFFASKV